MKKSTQRSNLYELDSFAFNCKIHVTFIRHAQVILQVGSHRFVEHWKLWITINTQPILGVVNIYQIFNQLLIGLSANVTTLAFSWSKNFVIIKWVIDNWISCKNKIGLFSKFDKSLTMKDDEKHINVIEKYYQEALEQGKTLKDQFVVIKSSMWESLLKWNLFFMWATLPSCRLSRFKIYLPSLFLKARSCACLKWTWLLINQIPEEYCEEVSKEKKFSIHKLKLCEDEANFFIALHDVNTTTGHYVFIWNRAT